MAVTHPAAVRTIIANAVVDSIDVGGAGSLIFQTTGSVEVATLVFSNPAFGNASGPTATANSIADDTSATGGTVSKFKIVNGSAADAGFAGAVAVSGSDINLTSLAIGANDTVSITSLTYTAPV
jgi:hypothetical protein